MAQPDGRIDLPAAIRTRAVRQVTAALAAQGAEVRFVGGCVRDAILDRPIHDIDFATPTKPEEVIAALEAANIKCVLTGLDHGTVTAVLGPAHFEITTLRRDLETDGRHATVAFTDDWAADAARRDFTMNALTCDADGALFDPAGGLADVKAGRVRFVGDAAKRIAEDHLRILRFFRFYAHYGRPPPDVEALKACRDAAEKIRTLSAERVRHEMLRTLAASDPLPALTIMDEAGVLRETLPAPAGLDVLPRLVALESEVGKADPLPRLAALLDEDGGDVATRVAGRLRLSNEQAKRLGAMLETTTGVGPNAPEPALKGALYRQGTESTCDALLLAWARADDTTGWRAQYDMAATWMPPAFPLTGGDVLALGVEPGARVGALLAQVEDWWVVEDFAPDRDACREKLREFAA